MKCQECTKEFEASRLQQKFCCFKCAKKAENHRRYLRKGLGIRTCDKCHKPFKRIRIEQTICSPCLQSRTCKKCNKEFSTRSHKREYCFECVGPISRAKKRYELYKAGTTLCRYCNKTFTRTYYKQSVCSDCRMLYRKPKKVLTIPERLEEGYRKLDHRSGYVYIYAPEHPEANTRGYVYEHRVVAEQKIGRRLLKNEVVHHKDEVRSNNDPDNLEVMDKGEHARLHNLGKRVY